MESVHIMSEPDEASDTSVERLPPYQGCSGRSPATLQRVDVVPAGFDGVLTSAAGDLQMVRSKKGRPHASQPPLQSPPATWKPCEELASLPLKNASDSSLKDTGSLRLKRPRCQVGELTHDIECVVVEADRASVVSAPERLDQGRDTVRFRRRWQRLQPRGDDIRPEASCDGFAIPGRDDSMPRHWAAHIFCLRRR